MKEVFKDIPNWEWQYQASNLWNIKTLFDRFWKERLLKPWNNWKWYLFVRFFKNWKWKKFYVHRLVLLTFKWSYPPWHETNHKFWDKSDNRLKMLEYTTKSQNQKHRFDVLWHTNKKLN